MCVAKAWRLTDAQQQDAEQLLVILWPAVCNPECWLRRRGIGSRRLLLDSEQQNACDAWLKQNAPEGFTWGELLVNVNANYDWHEHLQNTGDSLLVGLTHYVGGHLEIDDEAALPTSGRMIRFNGRRRHRTHPFFGLRVTLVAFTREVNRRNV